MNTPNNAKERFILAVLIAGIGLVLAARVTAQTFTTLHSFTATSGPLSTNSDGASPGKVLLLSGNTLYGTAQLGGSSGNGTVFTVNTDGTGFANLYNFTALSAPFYEGGTNSDGAVPFGGLILSNNTLYGTTRAGGSAGNGTVFSLNLDGTGVSTLHSFSPGGHNASNYYTNSDGAHPLGLILSSNTLYGTTSTGGAGNGTLFAINADGTGFTTLHSLTATDYFTGTNSDGVSPSGPLLLSGNTLYGTAVLGGSSGNGTVFALNTDGTCFRTLHSFAAGSFIPIVNSDGTWPTAPLIVSGNTLYGTASRGGTSSSGTVFALNTDGTGFTTIYSFTGGSDGALPNSGLVLTGNALYGTAWAGGIFDGTFCNPACEGNGTVFTVNTDGEAFTILHTFTARSGPTNGDGANPLGLTLSGNTLYGTTSAGGSAGNGTLFSISFSPQLAILSSEGNVILTWPANYAGFDYSGYTLQSTTNLSSSAVWTNNSPAPVVVNGQNTVTNPISGTQQFFRLSQ